MLFKTIYYFAKQQEAESYLYGVQSKRTPYTPPQAEQNTRHLPYVVLTCIALYHVISKFKFSFYVQWGPRTQNLVHQWPSA